MSNETADRNLLFGLLALQNGIITRDALVGAFSVWQLNKGRMLDEILVEQGALTAERQAQLQQMLAWHIEIHGQDAAQSLAAVSSASSACKALLAIGDVDLQASLQQVLKSVPTADPYATELEANRPAAASGLRFHSLRPHAKGGLGEVSVALDMELNREVALKEIQSRFADDQQSRERFVLEAEITGGLEHPGIVPVYGLGTYHDGRPFYAMRFIKGDSLKDALEQFHKPENRAKMSTGERQFQLRKLLGRFIDVCNAIEYAHSRGVLHRDLKPGNIMLGKYGETLVVDWGLAKSLGRKEFDTSEAAFQPASPLSASELTQPGSTIGTPSYMSPEQAAGRIDLLGPASDVYCLGATLYHILTGHPPLEGKDVGAVLQNAQKGEFPAPKERDRSVPRALNAICLKAMNLRIDDRYLSARRLADDVEHWLADEPVTALNDTIVEILSRFGRKNQSYVRASLFGLLIVSFVSVSAAFVINRERHKTTILATRNAELAVSERESKTDALRLANEMSSLANKNSKLAEAERGAKTRAEKLAKDERAARNLADSMAIDLKRALARSLYERSFDQHDKGFVNESDVSLLGGWGLTTTDDPMNIQMRQILLDRITAGGKQVVPAIRHSAPVESIAFSPDGTRFASASGETIGLWNAQTGTAICNPIRHRAGTLRYVGFSPDGKRLVSFGSGNTVRIWDANTGARTGNPMRHDSSVTCVAFSPDGARLVSGGEDHSLRLWDLQTQTMLVKPMNHTGGVNCVAFSPDGRRLVSGSDDKSLQLWDSSTGDSIGEPMEHAEPVRCVVYLDKWLIVSGDDAGIIRIWNPDTRLPECEPIPHEEGAERSIRCIICSPDKMRFVSASNTSLRLWYRSGNSSGVRMEHQSQVNSVGFSPDGSRIISGGDDNCVRLWDDSGYSLGDPLKHAASVTSVAFSPDANLLISGSVDKTVRIWDARPPVPVTEPMLHSDDITNVAFSPDGARIITSSRDKKLWRWNTTTGAALGPPLEHAHEITQFVLNPAGTRIASVCKDNSLTLWNVENGSVIGETAGHPGHILSVTFGSDGKHLLTGTKDRKLRLFSTQDELTLQTTTTLNNFLFRGDDFGRMAFSRDAASVFSESVNGRIAVWRTRTGASIRDEFGGGKGSSNFLTISSDGKRLAQPKSNLVQLWNVETRKPIGEVMKHSDTVTCAAFSSDGRRFVSGSKDNSLRLWDANSASQIGRLMVHSGHVIAVAFSPDGNIIASLGGDDRLRFWDGQTGAVLGTPINRVTMAGDHVVFSPDGKRVLTAGWPGKMELWSVSRPDLSQLSRSEFDKVITRWSGLDAEPQRKFKSFIPEVLLSSLKKRSRSDPLSAFQLRELQHSLPLFHNWQASHSEDDFDTFRAEFHLRRLCEIRRSDSQPVERLNQVLERRKYEDEQYGMDKPERLKRNLAFRVGDASFPKVTASYSCQRSSVERIVDGKVVYYDSDESRWSAAGSPNSSDWIEIEFERPTSFSRVELAICHDSGKGEVHPPSNYVLQILEGEGWREVPDQTRTPSKPVGRLWNVLTFESVLAKRIRIVFTHHDLERLRYGEAPIRTRSAIEEIAIWP